MTPLQPKGFRYEQADGIATLTLDRPRTLNALTFGVYEELRDTLRALARVEEVRAVVLTGAGRAFCSGGDVHEIIGELVKMEASELLSFTRLTGDLVHSIRALPQPVIAALPGTAAGAGAVIALACDFRIAAESARMAFLFVKVGLAGADMGAAWLLPRVVGLGRATELLMLGEAVSARDALAMGLVHRVVPEGQALTEALALARRLAEGPTFALAMTKQMLDQEAALGLPQALEAEAQAQQICMQTRDFREAYEAFVNKRPPRFVGR
jgi:enoyl-CoA hydratase/carnithine racemase